MKVQEGTHEACPSLTRGAGFACHGRLTVRTTHVDPARKRVRLDDIRGGQKTSVPVSPGRGVGLHTVAGLP